MQDRDAETVSLSLLQRFRLVRGGREVMVPPSVQRLLAYLAVRDRNLPRRVVAGELWPDADDAHAAASLRSTLHRERRVSALVVEANANLGLSPVVDVDVRRVGEVAQRTLALDHGSVPGAGDAPAPPGGDDHAAPPGGDAVLLSAELLPDWDELWLVGERERLRELSLHALEARATLLIDQGRLAEAVETAQTAVHMAGLRESAHRALIRARVAEGNYAAAMQQYREFRDRLEDELGIEPSPLIGDLMTAITDS